MEVSEIVRKYLAENGFDGLWNPDEGCGCELADLAPCGEMESSCCAGYKRPCDCGEGHDYDIGSEKHEAPTDE